MEASKNLASQQEKGWQKSGANDAGSKKRRKTVTPQEEVTFEGYMQNVLKVSSPIRNLKVTNAANVTYSLVENLWERVWDLEEYDIPRVLGKKDISPLAVLMNGMEKVMVIGLLLIDFAETMDKMFSSITSATDIDVEKIEASPLHSHSNPNFIPIGRPR